MENAVDGRTALIIAHRLATVKNCDRILVCDGGRIAQDGTYDELVAPAGPVPRSGTGAGLRVTSGKQVIHRFHRLTQI